MIRIIHSDKDSQREILSNSIAKNTRLAYAKNAIRLRDETWTAEIIEPVFRELTFKDAYNE